MFGKMLSDKNIADIPVKEEATSPVEDNNSQNIIRCLEALSNGDYTVVPNGNDSISQALKTVIERLKSIGIEELERCVNLSIQANETAIFSANMLLSLRKVDEQTQNIAAAAEEMEASVREISGHGDTIAKEAQDAQQETDSGTQSVEQAISGMKKITSSVEQVGERVSALEEFSGRVGMITETIKQIADQTNLLALNATIEAARAGEAGKGFAVVAAEVKTLASETAKATDEISGIVESIQSETTAISEAMDESNKAVTEGQSTINTVGDKMLSIKTKIDHVSASMGNISGILTEQGIASKEVAQGITEIAAKSSDSVDGIENIVDSMDTIEKLISGQVVQLAEIEVPDKVVKLAQSDHVIWKKRLANMVVGKEGLKESELADHHSCRLGKWYDTLNDPQYTKNPAFKELVTPHKLVHDHGKNAARLYNSGNLQGALEEIVKVEAASEDVLRLLADLETYKK
jgi:methyl-accepting chemotaxis protein